MLQKNTSTHWCVSVPLFCLDSIYSFTIKMTSGIIMFSFTVDFCFFFQLFLLELIRCLFMCSHLLWLALWKASTALNQVSYEEMTSKWHHILLCCEGLLCCIWIFKELDSFRVGSVSTSPLLWIYSSNQPSCSGVSAAWLCCSWPEATAGALNERFSTVSFLRLVFVLGVFFMSPNCLFLFSLSSPAQCVFLWLLSQTSIRCLVCAYTIWLIVISLCFCLPEGTSHGNGQTTSPETSPGVTRHIAALLLYFTPEFAAAQGARSTARPIQSPWSNGRETLWTITDLMMTTGFIPLH